MGEISGGILKLEKLTFIASIILVIISAILIGIILLQPGKSDGMKATTGGKSETFYGSGKARGIETIISRFTVFIAVVFIMASASMYILPLLKK